MLINARKLHRSGRPDLILVAIDDVTARSGAEAHRDVLISEMSHRVKNVLAAVQSIASQTLQQSGSLARFYSFTLPIRRPADCPPRTSLSFDRRQRRKRFSVPR
jgi:HWE histidine kinase